MLWGFLGWTCAQVAIDIDTYYVGSIVMNDVCSSVHVNVITLTVIRCIIRWHMYMMSLEF